MNNIFKKAGKDKIQIDNNYFLETDSFRGIVLVREFEKERKKKDETVETYLAQERWYYPRVVMALEKYFDDKHNSDLSKIKENTEEALKVLKEFRDNFKDW